MFSVSKFVLCKNPGIYHAFSVMFVLIGFNISAEGKQQLQGYFSDIQATSGKFLCVFLSPICGHLD